MKIRFKPKSDITAYELAWILTNAAPLNEPITIEPELWDHLAHDIQRHFEIIGD